MCVMNRKYDNHITNSNICMSGFPITEVIIIIIIIITITIINIFIIVFIIVIAVILLSGAFNKMGKVHTKTEWKSQ